MESDHHINSNKPGDEPGFPKVTFTRIVSKWPLTKTYSLKDGSIEKQGAPNFSSGTALLWDAALDEVTAGNLDYRTVNVYGQPTFDPRPDGKWDVVTRAFYAENPKPGSVPRTKDEGFRFDEGPGVILLDSDPRPDAVPPIPALTGAELMSIVESVMPSAAGAAYHATPSASAGICLESTGEIVHDKGGIHVYLAALDATDLARFGDVLCKRLWLAGHGHIDLSASGAMLVRTVIDGSVFESNRVDYISPAKLGAGLIRKAPDPASRPGGYLDTRQLLDLNQDEERQYQELLKRHKDDIKPRADSVRLAYIGRKVDELAATGVGRDIAERTIKRAIGEKSRHLFGDFILVFSDARLGPVSVREVLANPDRFDSQSLADPIEGTAYGTTTAKFFANTGKGSPVVYSFAHGAHAVYQLHSVEAIEELTREEAWEIVNRLADEDDDQSRSDQLADEIAPQIFRSELIKERDKRKLLGTIAKLAGATYSSLIADLRGFEKVSANATFNHLEAAREVVKSIGADNIIGQPSFLWRWQARGVWTRIDDREIKRAIHDVAGTNELTGAICASILDLFKTEVFKPDHQFDIDARAINTPSGELHWAGDGWRLEPHNREHYRTTQIPVEYDPFAACPRFEQFLGEIFEHDADAVEKVRVVKQLLGYSLTVDCSYEKFTILVGSGANGKTVLLHVLLELLGRSNVAAVQPSQFDNRFQRAHLHGKLANIVTEIAEGAELADAALKAIVSGELTTAEHKHKPPFDFTPFATCWFGTNHMPHSRDFSDALFRRAIVLTFNNKFEGDRCDEGLKGKLVAELPGILNLALDGLADVYRNGFIEPSSCVAAKAEWRLQCDQVGRFIEDCCTASRGKFEESARVYQAYKDWALSEGIGKVLGKNALTIRLKARGFASDHNPTRTKRVIWGLSLNGADHHWSGRAA